MNAANHSPGRRVTHGDAVGATRTVDIEGTRQVYRVSGAGPLCLVHAGGPGVHPDRPEAAEAGRMWDAANVAQTLEIAGAYDFICPPRFAYELQAGMPDARLRELRESGHFGHIEEADEFAAAVLAFVDDQKRGNRT